MAVQWPRPVCARAFLWEGRKRRLEVFPQLAACGVRGFLFRCPGGLASESCCCSSFRNLPVRHPRALWEGGRDGLGAQIVSASESQVGSRRLPGPPRLQIWACLPPGPRLGLPRWPLTARGAAAPDTASLGDAHLPWPGSVHTALPSRRPAVPTGEISLPPAGPGQPVH